MSVQARAALRQAVRMYLIIGVVLVAAGVRSWSPALDAPWPERLVWIASEVVLWPKVFPEMATRSGIALPHIG